MANAVFSFTEYDFQIPKGLIAQEPAIPRDSCRLLIADRKDSVLREKVFRDVIDYFRRGDLMVLNNTKVIRARIFARRESGGRVEILLLREREEGIWEALVNPARRVKTGEKLKLAGADYWAKVIGKTDGGWRILEFSPLDLSEFLPRIGAMPLPPYIKKEVQDPDSYQTVYAGREGAVAAPTAGLHFTPLLIKKMRAKGVKVLYITLHCGLATFRPIKCEDIRNHPMEPEWAEISPSAARAINQAKKDRRRIIAVGTTGVRALEFAASLSKGGLVKAFRGFVNLYITPGYKFRVVDALITNFHTPCSTNLVLVSAFSGLDLMRKSYVYARDAKFRFYSFGDAMLLL
jgi:S-adenosylmethionine:tRNA ribosyltransferase-isomerase